MIVPVIARAEAVTLCGHQGIMCPVNVVDVGAI